MQKDEIAPWEKPPTPAPEHAAMETVSVVPRPAISLWRFEQKLGISETMEGDWDENRY